MMLAFPETACRRLLSLLVLILLPTACGESTATPISGPPAAAATGVPTPGPDIPPTEPPPPPGQKTGGSGTLRWANEGVEDLDTLDPALANANNSVMAVGLLFEGLVRLDSHLAIQPAGAASWDISEDGRTYTFHIRPDLRWADGSPVSAEDFRWSIERALAPENSKGSASYYLSNITGAPAWTAGQAAGLTGVTVRDNQTLQMHIEQPGLYFLYQISFAAADVVPRKLIDQFGSGWVRRAWGTGPFKLKEWRRGERLLFEPNPYYWRGAVQLDGIDMPLIGDPKAAYDLYQAGSLDIMGSQQFPATQATASRGNADFHQLPQFFAAYIGFNNQRPPLDNRTLRRALALAVDKRRLTERILGGGARATDHIVPEGMPGYFPGLQPLAFDAAAAKRELVASGYKDGTSVPRLSLTYNAGQADFDKVAATLQQMWKQNLGVMVSVQSMEQEPFNDSLNALAATPANSPLQLYASVWGADYPDPQNFLTQQLHTGVGNNNGHYSNADFDRLTDQADVEKDPTKRMDLYHQAEQIAVNEVGWLPLYNTLGNLLMKPSVKGLTFTAQGLFTDDWTQVTNK